MTCEANEKIVSIEAQWPGCVHDRRIWRLSGIQDVVHTYDGDSGYGVTPWLLSPFEESRKARERNVPKLVLSCAVLHNIAKHLNDASEVEDGIENAIDEDSIKFPSTQGLL